MATILNIDTATDIASIDISHHAESIGRFMNDEQKDHAAWIQPAIQQLLKDVGISAQDLEAVAVTAGPGSYTGLRVGMASAKGLCYALNLPLITVNTLEVMALAAMQHEHSVTIFCPMIDARRQEVFAALYNRNMDPIMAPSAIVLNENSFQEELEQQAIVFSGNGTGKWRLTCRHPHARFSAVQYNASHLGMIAEKKYFEKQFNNLFYSEPVYIKEFYTYHK